MRATVDLVKGLCARDNTTTPTDAHVATEGNKGKSYTTQTAYDNADRVTQVTYPNNRAVVAYSYDTAGREVKAESLWGTGLNEVFRVLTP